MKEFNKKGMIIFMLLFVYTLSVLVYAQSDIENELERLRKQLNVPGTQIVHTKNGESIAYSLGEIKYGSGEMVSEKTLFQCASMTKVVASYAMLKLYDKGLFDLDKPLSDYWTYDRLKDDPYLNEITARRVLNHTTGLPNWARNKPLKTAFPPGAGYRYSGEGFYYLQQVLEHLTGMSFDRIVEEEVFIPFGMENSSLVYDDKKEHLYAYGHKGDDGLQPSEMRKLRKANAASTMLTTAEDYTKFVQKGLLNEEGGLHPETLKMMLTTSSSLKPYKAHEEKEYYKYLTFGLGILLQENEVGKAITHTGSNQGRYLSVFIAYPETNESLVILTNSTTGSKFREKVAELLLDEQTFWVFNR